MMISQKKCRKTKRTKKSMAKHPHAKVAPSAKAKATRSRPLWGPHGGASDDGVIKQSKRSRNFISFVLFFAEILKFVLFFVEILKILLH